MQHLGPRDRLCNISVTNHKYLRQFVKFISRISSKGCNSALFGSKGLVTELHANQSAVIIQIVRKNLTKRTYLKSSISIFSK